MPRITNCSVRPISINERTGETPDGTKLHRPVTLAPGQTSEDIELHDPEHPVYKGLEAEGSLAYDLSDEDVAKFEQAARNPFTPNTSDHLLVGAREARWAPQSGPEAPAPQPNSLRTPAAAVSPGPLSAAPRGLGGRPHPAPELAAPPASPEAPGQPQPRPAAPAPQPAPAAPPIRPPQPQPVPVQPTKAG